MRAGMVGKVNGISRFAKTRYWLLLGAGMPISIRNRQVAGSSPALGSTETRSGPET